MFLDEYERREDFDRWMKAVREDPEQVKLTDDWFPKWDALTIPGSKKFEARTEVEGLRVEFKRLRGGHVKIGYQISFLLTASR